MENKNLDMEILFGKIIKYISERNIVELEKLYDKHKVFRYSSQSYLENFDMDKPSADELISIGYNRALLDIMQAFVQETKIQKSIQDIGSEKKDKILLNLSKQSCLSGDVLSYMLGMDKSELASIIDEMNRDIMLVNIEQLGENRLYSIAPKGYKYITSK